MGISAKELGEGENVLFHLRTHPKAIWLPIVALLTLTAVLITGLVLMPVDARPIGTIVLVVAVVVGAIVLGLVPILKWASRTFTVTNRRVMTRRGILHRTGHDIGINKINSVATERSLSDRMLGCGTLKLDTASDAGTVELHDIPHVEKVSLGINGLLFTGDHE